MRKNNKGKASLFLQTYLPPEESAMMFSFGINLLKFSEDDLMRAKKVVCQYNSSNKSQKRIILQVGFHSSLPWGLS